MIGNRTAFKTVRMLHEQQTFIEIAIQQVWISGKGR